MAKTQGWIFLGTTRVEQCLAWVAQEDIDMFLLDYHMPGANGLDVLGQIKAIAPALTVLILTVEQQPRVAEELLVAGADDFINKPIHLADFLSRINLHRKLQSSKRNPEKGISREKMRRILTYLRSNDVPVEINEVSLQCEMSYATAHRYLDYLVRNGFVISDELPRSGKQGRPTHSYRFRGITSADTPPD
ncbi:MAG: response regulator [Betaproteobacteria bacterium]|nr:response regulator [Betaproteobacteria bacterium]